MHIMSVCHIYLLLNRSFIIKLIVLESFVLIKFVFYDAYCLVNYYLLIVPIIFFFTENIHVFTVLCLKLGEQVMDNITSLNFMYFDNDNS